VDKSDEDVVASVAGGVMILCTWWK
jgi:hypothetical protein